MTAVDRLERSSGVLSRAWGKGVVGRDNLALWVLERVVSICFVSDQGAGHTRTKEVNRCERV